MTTRPADLTFGCTLCGGRHGHLAENTTITVDDEGGLWLLGLCPVTGRTHRSAVGDMLRAVLTHPVLLDPDVREHELVTRLQKATQ